jgi:deoxyxylulose-5-phosphate synthase
VKLIQISPIPYDKIFALTLGAKLVYLFEEGILAGSVSEKIAARASVNGCSGAKYIIRAIENTFVPHGETDELFEARGLDAKSAAKEIYEALNKQ